MQLFKDLQFSIGQALWQKRHASWVLPDGTLVDRIWHMPALPHCGMVRNILRQTFVYVVFARGSCHSFTHSFIQYFLQQPENSLASLMSLELAKVIKCWLIYRSGSMNKWRLQCSKESHDRRLWHYHPALSPCIIKAGYKDLKRNSQGILLHPENCIASLTGEET